MRYQSKSEEAGLEHMCRVHLELVWGDVKPNARNSATPWNDRDVLLYQAQLKALYRGKVHTSYQHDNSEHMCTKPGESFDYYFTRKLQVVIHIVVMEPPANTTVDCLGAAI